MSWKCRNCGRILFVFFLPLLLQHHFSPSKNVELNKINDTPSATTLYNVKLPTYSLHSHFVYRSKRRGFLSPNAFITTSNYTLRHVFSIYLPGVFSYAASNTNLSKLIFSYHFFFVELYFTVKKINGLLEDILELTS